MIAVFSQFKRHVGDFIKPTGRLFWMGLFLLIVPLIPAVGMKGLMPPDVFRTVFIQLFSAWLLVLYLSDVLFKDLPKLKLDRYLVLFSLLFLAYAALSLLWTANVFHGLTILLRWLPALVFGGFICVYWQHFKAIEFVVLAVVLSLVVVSILGLAQWYLGFDGIDQHVIPAATFGNKNMAVHFVSAGFPLLWVCYLGAKKNINRNLNLGALLLVLAFLLVTGTRAGYVSVFISTTLIGFLYYHASKRGEGFVLLDRLGRLHLLLSVAFVLLLIMTDESASQGVSGLWGAVSFGTVESRWATYLNTLSMFKDFWLKGSGLGSWESIYPLYSFSIASELGFGTQRLSHHVHNDWLEVFATLGVIGGGLLIGMVYLVCRRFWYLFGLIDQSRVLYLLGVFGGLVGLGVIALFSFPMMMPIGPLFLCALLGFLTSDTWLNSGSNNSLLRPKKKRFKCIVFYTLVVLVMGPVLYHGYLRLSARIYYSQALFFKAHKSADLLIEAATLGISAYPMDYRFLGLLGDGYGKSNLTGKAVDYYNRFLAFEPNNPRYLWSRSQALWRLNSIEKAKKDLLHLVNMIPTHLNALKMLVYLSTDVGNQVKYLYQLTSLSFSKPHLKILANLAIKIKNWEKAIWALENLLQYEPNSAIIYQNLSAIYQHLGDQKESKFYHDKFLDLKNN